MNYTGIGSRATPVEVQQLFTRIATRLEQRDYTLRSGGAAGADSAFERGVIEPSMKEIFLPWPKFNGNQSSRNSVFPEALEMAESFHPAWNKCGQAARKFHARNCYQILGWELDDPSAFLVCWTPAGKITGGTGQALRIAKHYNIPIVNFGLADAMDHLFKLIEGEDA